ncbi:MAG: hypothetical protein R2728_09500 [Chitinophagales bacterium]
MDTSDLVRIDFNPTMFVPASAQGILAYQIRTEDERMAKIASVLVMKTVRILLILNVKF